MRGLALVMLLATLACDGSPTDPGEDSGLVFGRRAMSPVPASYGAWYAATETCLGLTGNFPAIAWFLADSVFRPDGTKHVGRWIAPDTIIMAGQIHDEPLVRVYMIEHITQADSIRFADATCRYK